MIASTKSTGFFCAYACYTSPTSRLIFRFYQQRSRYSRAMCSTLLIIGCGPESEKCLAVVIEQAPPIHLLHCHPGPKHTARDQPQQRWNKHAEQHGDGRTGNTGVADCGKREAKRQ